MDAIDRPLTRLHEATDLFVVAKEVRLLHAVASASLRIRALETMVRFEHHPANRAPWFVLEAPADATDAGWSTRIDELRSQWDLRTVEKARPRFPAIDRAVAEESVTAFGVELQKLCGLVPKRLEGMVVVLSPLYVHDRARWLAELDALIGAGALDGVRFVVLDLEEPIAAPIAARLGPRALAADARIDPAAIREELGARVEAMKKHFGATDHRATGLGAPDVPPPLRGRPASSEAVRVLMRTKGLNENLAPDGEIPLSRLRALEAAIAFRDGRVAEAVRLQIEARDALDRARVPHDAGIAELIAAMYALQGGAHAESERMLLSVGERASTHDDPMLGLLARNALGALYLLANRYEQAAAIYADAAPLAKRAAMPELEVDAWRLAGDSLARAGRPDDAARAWVQAIRVAEDAGPAVSPRTSAPEIALQLAAIYDEHGLTDHAAALRAQSRALAGARVMPR
jgi:tetratricopeptide (TPR) repeat protein